MNANASRETFCGAVHAFEPSSRGSKDLEMLIAGFSSATGCGSMSAGFRRSLPKSLLISLANLVRSINCYCSNLIEGHDTHPIDIERALKGNYSKDAKKRDLQIEAKAHIEVQQWIDGGSLDGRAVTAGSIREIHRRFCELLLNDLLWW